jgi:hypothetical protein
MKMNFIRYKATSRDIYLALDDISVKWIKFSIYEGFITPDRDGHFLTIFNYWSLIKYKQTVWLEINDFVLCLLSHEFTTVSNE